MFPSMNNSYPLFYNQSQSLTATSENNHISFQHHQQEFYSSNFSIPTNTISPNIISTNPINTVLSEAPIHLENPMTNQFQHMGNNHNNNNLSSIRRVSGRKDRHTKICTAQGVRDRRVRLSISIAREFFNLQDMLGFDKASKTLGWLMEKSKAAIDELTRCGNKRSTVNEAECSVPNLQWNKVLVGENIVDNCVDDENNENEDVCEEKKDGDCGKVASKKRGLLKHNYCNNDRSFAKEIMKSKRVKTRERARERTKHKKTMMNYKNHEVGCISVNHQQQCDQQKNEHNSIFRQSNCGANTLPSTSFSFGVNNVVRESVVVKSKSKESSQDYTNFEMISSKDHNEQMDYSNYYYNDHFTKFELENNHVGIIQQPPGLSAFNIINLSTENMSFGENLCAYNTWGMLPTSNDPPYPALRNSHQCKTLGYLQQSNSGLDRMALHRGVIYN